MQQRTFTLGPDDIFEGWGKLQSSSPGAPEAECALAPVSALAEEPPSGSPWSRKEALRQLKAALRVDVPPQLVSALPPCDNGRAAVRSGAALALAPLSSYALYAPQKTLQELHDHCEALCSMVTRETAQNDTGGSRSDDPLAAVFRLLESKENGAAVAQELSTRALMASSEVRHWATKGKTEFAATIRADPTMPFHTEDSLDELIHRLTVFGSKVRTTHRLAVRMNRLLDQLEAVAPLVDAALAAQDRLETASTFTSERVETTIDDLHECVKEMKTSILRSTEVFRANASALKSRLKANPTFTPTARPRIAN